MAMLVNLTVRVPQAMIKGFTKLACWASSERRSVGLVKGRLCNLVIVQVVDAVRVHFVPAPMLVSELSLRFLSSSRDFSDAWK